MNTHRAGACLLAALAMILPGKLLAQPTTPAPTDAPSKTAHAAISLTLEQIMSDPDWIARSPERPYWSDDSKAVYYSQKRSGDDRRDLWRLNPTSGDARIVPPEELPTIDSRFGDFSRDRSKKIYARAGDIYIKDLTKGIVRQLTRTGDNEFSPGFLVDEERLAYQRGPQWYVRELATGLEYQVADIRAEKKPEEKKENADYLKEQQERLFDYVRKTKQSREVSKREGKEEAAADTQRVARPWYLGDDKEIREVSLSPTGEFVLVRLAKKTPRDARSDTMPAYVTEDGYVSTRSVRSKVGVAPRTSEELVLLDLRNRPWKEPLQELDAKPVTGDNKPAEPSKAPDSAEPKASDAGTATPKSKPTSDDGVYRVDLSVLPEIAVDRLKDIREQAEAWKKVKQAKRQAEASNSTTIPAEAAAPSLQPEPAKPAEVAKEPKEPNKPDDSKPRAVSISRILWSEDGQRVIVQAYSIDNKDRWIAEVDLSREHRGELHPLEHFHDEAWINGQFADFGWLPDNPTMWFLSEETGFSQLYFRDVSNATRWSLNPPPANGEPTQPFEVVDASLNRAGNMLYFTASLPGRPGVREGYRALVGPAPLAARRAMIERGSLGVLPIQQLTELGGQNEIFPAPDDRSVLVLHSTTTRPPELYLQPIVVGKADPDVDAFRPRQLTHTTTPEFQSLSWIVPEVLPIPGRDGRVIWSRVYDTSIASKGNDTSPSSVKRPAVLFIHGAGYLQDAHEGWSYYFHEFMFHTLLVQRGYVVLDMDFRASAGYGRDWRTAIYRTMGYPELEDLADGVEWLAKERGIDPARVGCYGGSYGGFLTLMAMFTKPDLFQCGAALRPVTDWAHYNDGYTANILNTPAIDPEPFEKCSPIEHASGLKGHLLICHGMLDDNVLFEDTVRLSQRLIELKKENWEVAAFPIEAHAFKEPTSWLDEFRRIDKLFRTHLER